MEKGGGGGWPQVHPRRLKLVFVDFDPVVVSCERDGRGYQFVLICLKLIVVVLQISAILLNRALLEKFIFGSQGSNFLRLGLYLGILSGKAGLYLLNSLPVIRTECYRCCLIRL